MRVDKAIEFALSHINNIDTIELEKYCGVGVVVTPEQIEKCVERHINTVKTELVQKRYRFNAGPVMQKVREELPWADGKAVKNEIDLQIFDILGPKTEADLAPVAKSDKKIAKTPKNEKPKVDKTKTTEEFKAGKTKLVGI